MISRKVWREKALPKGLKSVSDWKVKRNDSGTIVNWKVWWIVQGFRQCVGHDYDKTFVAVTNIVSCLKHVCDSM